MRNTGNIIHNTEHGMENVEKGGGIRESLLHKIRKEG